MPGARRYGGPSTDLRTVAEVAQLIAEAFPGEPDTLLRTALFIRELVSGQFMKLFVTAEAD